MKAALLTMVVAMAAYGQPAGAVPLDDIRLPDGFEISVYAEVPNARSLALSDDGAVFVGNRAGDKVWGLRDTDGDDRADERWVVLEGLDMPNGVAWHEGALFVAENQRILRIGREEAMRRDGAQRYKVVRDDLPDDDHHGWRFIDFGPDGLLYLSIGVPCNVCEEPGFGHIERMRPDGSEVEVVARGVRNSVGFDFDPATGDLWFTDNGRDWMGDDLPSCELNHLSEVGQHFGFPYCHQGDLPDPEYGRNANCEDYRAPAALLGPHVAPLGMAFYDGGQFPTEYHGKIFIAEHGSWNRSEKIGYQVVLADPDFDRDKGKAKVTVFAAGWLQGQSASGRPVDVLVMPDGALLVSDDAADLVYRISYRKAD
ncbi:MAG: PQQ-dependent sugar dehydrogenase [Gammaproteobacteria bacterium]|nr:PQQ-dependent sugar dehydrogenase [Gammaproteobacteria bacterium]